MHILIKATYREISQTVNNCFIYDGLYTQHDNQLRFFIKISKYKTPINNRYIVKSTD